MKEERIKELKDMMYMINNYEVIATEKELTYDFILHVKYAVFVRRTEYSKIIAITYNGNKINKIKDDYNYTILSGMGIDNCDIIKIKQGIVDELMQLGAEKVF